MERRVLLTGCSGGGNSTLVAELAKAGYAVVEEPGRRVMTDARASGGTALPWADPTAFARRALALALADHAAAAGKAGWTFFDRGIVDTAVALSHAAGGAIDPAAATCRYHRRVFVAPPWPDLFGQDADRRHDFHEAVAEHGRIEAALPPLGYEPVALPYVGVVARVAFVLAALP